MEDIWIYIIMNVILIAGTAGMIWWYKRGGF